MLIHCWATEPRTTSAVSSTWRRWVVTKQKSSALPEIDSSAGARLFAEVAAAPPVDARSALEASGTGPHVQVESGTGKVFYDGNFGSSGTYAFTTHTGDIEALIAPDASADFSARSMQGFVKSDVPLKPKEHNRFVPELGRSFFGTMGKAASEVILKSISGTIRLKQR